MKLLAIGKPFCTEIFIEGMEKAKRVSLYYNYIIFIIINPKNY